MCGRQMPLSTVAYFKQVGDLWLQGSRWEVSDSNVALTSARKNGGQQSTGVMSYQDRPRKT